MSPKLSILGLPLGLLLLVASCSIQAHAQPYQPGTIAEAMEAALYLSQFKEFASQAGLYEQFLDPEFEGTVFAPSDAAFANTTALAGTDQPVEVPPAAATGAPPVYPPATAPGAKRSLLATPETNTITGAVSKAATTSADAVGSAWDSVKSQFSKLVANDDASTAPKRRMLQEPANTTAEPTNMTAKTDALPPGVNLTNPVTKIVAFHIVPTVRAFPVRTLTQGTKLNTTEGSPLIIDRRVPGLIHVYGNDPMVDPLNFGTILLWQEIRGGKAVLYVIDRVLTPPAPADEIAP